jgi:CheY-like chemotaxis protein
MLRFLVHDDGATHCEILEQHLSEQHKTKFVSTIAEVVTALQDEKFDLVLVNIRSKNDVIFTVLAALQNNLCDISLICLRGPDAPPMAGFDDAYFMALMIAGASGYITCSDYSLVNTKLEEYLPNIADEEQSEALIA